jgi:ubiquinone/menaquinone biosynthesis C-methylase UbiE
VTDLDHVASARAVYDAAASRYVEFVGTEINSTTEAPIDRALLTAFVELVQGGPAGRVADVGCGPGRVAALLAGSGLDVVGVDVSEAMLDAARHAHPHLRFELGELADLPMEDEVLSGAVYWYSIIYTPPDRLRQAFLELARVMMPEGHVLVGFQSGNGESRHRPQAHETEFPLTNYLHNIEWVAGQLEGAGFTIGATVARAPHHVHEHGPHGFVLARRAVEQPS